MDQQILPTKKNRLFVRSTGSLRSRNGEGTSWIQNFRINYFQRRSLLVCIDMLLLLVGLFGSWWLTHTGDVELAGVTISGLSDGRMNWFWIGTFLATWFLFGWLTDLYDVRFAHVRGMSVVRIVLVTVLSLLVVVLITFLVRGEFPLVYVLAFLGSGLLLVTLWRFAYAALSATALFGCNVVVLGTGPVARMTANLLEQEQGLRYAVLGYVSESPNVDAVRHDGYPVLQVTTSLLDLVRDLNVGEIVLSQDHALDPAFCQDVVNCQANGVCVSSVPAIYHRLREQVPVEHVDSSWLLEAVQSATSIQQRICKRTIDLTVCLVLLPWLLIVFPLIALAIKLDSSGPVFFRQERSGRGGKVFRILKFRTMFAKPEGEGSVRKAHDGKPSWTDENDPRITRVGYYLRKLRLDELPQIYNILRGEMSLIGPRPELTEFVPVLEKSLPHYGVRLLVPPGLTGWAQIKHGYVNSVDDTLIKLQYDIDYVLHWSLWLDLYILFNTVRVVIGAKGR